MSLSQASVHLVLPRRHPVYLSLARPWTELIIVINSCLLYEYCIECKISDIWYAFKFIYGNVFHSFIYSCASFDVEG